MLVVVSNSFYPSAIMVLFSKQSVAGVPNSVQCKSESVSVTITIKVSNSASSPDSAHGSRTSRYIVALLDHVDQTKAAF